jgi:hypothetical protein
MPTVGDQHHLSPWLPWSDDGDRVQVVRPDELVAGAWTEIELAVTIQGRPLERNQRIGIGVPFGFPPPCVDDPRAEAYTTAAGPDGVELSVERMEGREHFVWIAVGAGRLDPGDPITVRYGDRRFGSPGVRAPKQALREMLLPCFRDEDGEILSPGSARVTVRPGSSSSLRVHLPGSARSGETVRLRVVAQDPYGNCPDASGRVALLNTAAGRGLRGEMVLKRGSGEVELAAPDSGTLRVVVRDPAAGAEGVSNPMGVLAEGRRLYFGDIHAHTELSYDAGGTIEEMYEYARDVAGLDFAAAADHQTAIAGLSDACGHVGGIPGVTLESMPERWRATCDAAARFHEPGRFITFAAFEFAPHEFEGHRNVYWLADHPEMLHAQGSTGEWLQTQPLSRLIREGRVLAIPHHPPIMWRAGVREGGGLVYGDLPGDVQPVVEICSKHGTSEHLDNERPLRGQCTGSFVADFLEDGHRFGFIGGSDTHLANPGSPLRDGPYATLRFRAGLAAVWAEDLTREAIWEALCARRCYATTGPKLGLRFWVGDLFMGEEGAVEGERRVRVEAHGEGPIILIEIVKNGRVIARWDPHRPRLDVTFAHEAPDRAERPIDYYYARVRQHDGERAWSSPVWVSEAPHDR